VQKGSEVDPLDRRISRSLLLLDTNKSMDNAYTTSDFYLTAFLVASGVPLSSHERWNGKTSFKFALSDGLNELIDEYYADHVKVSPIRYGNSLKNIKALIYSGNTNMHTNGKHELTHSIRATR
jgi:hypothetical protein